MIRPIVSYDHPVLAQPGEAVRPGDPSIAALAQDLLDTLAASATGIGLAAQQIGDTRRVCVVDLRGVDPDFRWMLDERTPPLELVHPLVLVNPVARHPRGAEETTEEEGCLSFPDLRGPVRRREHVVVRFEDLAGQAHELEADGLFGRCLLHEIDHLDGVLFIDRMDKAARRRLEPALRALRLASRARRADDSSR